MDSSVTIGVCVKDSEKTIGESVNSIINQKYPPELIQAIIVDGCSKDKTLCVIDEITEKTQMQFETYSDKGEGLGTARQIVVNKAKGKYIIFVDGDVRVFSDFVRNHVKFMDENPSIGAAFGRPMFQEEETLIATVWNLRAYAAGGGLGNDATIYRSEALQQVGGFDKKIKGAAEDRDLIIRFRLHGWQTSVNQTARFFHKRRENLRSFLVENSWMGYGDHYYNRKFGGNIDDDVWRRFPAADFVYGLKLASRAYEQTRRKLSFLILPEMILACLSWWAGFAKGRKDSARS